MCSYGSPQKQNTSLLTNMVALLSLARKCTRSHPHPALGVSQRNLNRDGLPSSCNRVSLAGEYTWELAEAWALAAYEQAPQAAFQPDLSNFNGAVYKRLQEIAAWKHRSKSSAACSSQPGFTDSKGYRRPVLVGHQTGQQVQWLKNQGA